MIESSADPGGSAGAAASGCVLVDDKLASQKTPITLLQEICTRKGITPQYELLSSEGSQDSAFVFRAMVSADLQATAAGKSKKLAKHLAAKALLERILLSSRAAEFPLSGRLAGLSTEEALDFVRKLLPEAEKPLKATDVTMTDEALDVGPGNPIGKLQELTMSKRWPPPTYDDVRIEGKPNNCWFVVSCRLGEFIQKGESRTKRNAKKVAAEKMFNFLTRSHSGSNDGPEHDEDELTQTYSTPNIEQLDEHFKQMKLGDLNGVSEEQLKAKEKKVEAENPSQATLDSLKRRNFSTEKADVKHELTLANICKVEGWGEPKYSFIARFNKLGRYQCLVQLDSNPVAVCYGTGLTMDAARYTAARNALEYLKITTDPMGFIESP